MNIIYEEKKLEPEYNCPWCGYKGCFKKKTQDIMCVLIFLLLLCIFIIPGIIYFIWLSGQKECPKCGAMLPKGPF